SVISYRANNIKLHRRASAATPVVFFFKQKTAYEILADWSSDVCSSDLDRALRARVTRALLDRSAGSVALLVITHDLTFAAETLERGLVLDRGSLACDEPLAGLLGDVTRLEPLGLAPPPVAALSVALDL